MYARTVDVAEAGSLEAAKTGSVGLSAAEGADIEYVRPQRGLQGGIIELGIVRERHDGGAAIELHGCHRLVRPLADELYVGKAGIGGEGAARVDDGDGIAGQRRHWRQRLRDMHGADDDET